MKLLDYTIAGYELRYNNRELKEYIKGIVWWEIEVEEREKPLHSRYVDTIEGVAIWYNYAADYYFFEEVEV